MAERYKRNSNTKCLVCSISIYRRPAEIKNSKGRAFCSQTCYGISCRKESPCVVCGTLILAGANKKTCSRICANKHRTGIKYKINSPRDKVKDQRSLKLRLINYAKPNFVLSCCEAPHFVVGFLAVEYKMAPTGFEPATPTFLQTCFFFKSVVL